MFQPIKKVVVGVAALAALALGGSAIAGAATSSTTSGTTTSTSAPSSSGTQTPPKFSGPAHGTAAHEDAEKAVTGAAATKAQAAAVKSVGSGTAGAVTTDFTGNGYETTVTKSDGTKVEVHLDSSYTVMRVGPGGHGPGGRSVRSGRTALRRLLRRLTHAMRRGPAQAPALVTTAVGRRRGSPGVRGHAPQGGSVTGGVAERQPRRGERLEFGAKRRVGDQADAGEREVADAVIQIRRAHRLSRSARRAGRTNGTCASDTHDGARRDGGGRRLLSGSEVLRPPWWGVPFPS